MSNSTTDDMTRFTGSVALITGGCGFIGSHLAEALAIAGAHVVVVDNLQAGKQSNLAIKEVDIELIDVRDADGIARIIRAVHPNYVFHLAANASVPGSVTDPVYDFEANTAGTFVVLNALRELKEELELRKVVIASSGAVYGEPKSFPIAEEDYLKPISPYGAAKLCAEVETRIFHHVYCVPTVIARIFNSYGPRMARFVVLDFLRKLRKDPANLEILGSGRQVRDFTYVADTVRGLLLLALRGADGEAYNISSGTNYTVTDLAHAIIAALELTNITSLSFTGESWVGDAQRWEVSIEKLRALGYEPSTSLEQGLSQTISWFEHAEPA